MFSVLSALQGCIIFLSFYHIILILIISCSIVSMPSVSPVLRRSVRVSSISAITSWLDYNIRLEFSQFKFNILARCDMAFIEPMYRTKTKTKQNKNNITYIFICMIMQWNLRWVPSLKKRATCSVPLSIQSWGVASLGAKLVRRPWMILWMRPAKETRRYIVTSSLIGWRIYRMFPWHNVQYTHKIHTV